MAFRNTSTRTLADDRDLSTSVGIDYPVTKGNDINGYFMSTTTKLAAAKNNVRMLLETQVGERLMQPRLGTGLRRYLFEQYTDEIRIMIENDIVDAFALWLPFITLLKIEISMQEQTALGNNSMIISLTFAVSSDPNNTESVSVSIGE